VVRGSPQLWERVRSDAELVRAAQEADPGSPSDVQRLRKRWGAEEVAIALDLAAARHKLERKWPGDDLVGDVAGAEMASSARAARWKAGRFAGRGLPIIDLCSGIGCDARALAEVGDTAAVDLDPIRAWMTGRNSGAAARVADIAAVDVFGALVHIDPSRRSGTDGRRTWRYEDLEPPPDVFEPVCARAEGAAIKLGPGVDPDALPEGELVFISEAEPAASGYAARRLTQAVLFSGQLRRDEPRRAVLLASDGVASELAGEPGTPRRGPMPEPGGWVFAIDPAIERAGLIGLLAEQTGLGCPHPRAGLLSGPALVDDPWLTAFEVIGRLPWDLRAVAGRLGDLGAGVVEVKVRGVREDPDRLQARLRGDGDDLFMVFVTRFGDAVETLITRRRGL